MNDTGSDILTLFDIDLPYPGVTMNHPAWFSSVRVEEASGNAQVFPMLAVEDQLVNENYEPSSGWVSEIAVVREHRLGLVRLSGAGIRNHFYFATAPGNRYLAVAATRHGLMALLPSNSQ